MPRLQPIQVADTQGQTRQQLESVQRALGVVPNLLKTMANSPAALAGYLGFSQALGNALSAPLREQIALAVAGANRCDYCASAHTALGTKAGLDAGEMAANLHGQSDDPSTQAALTFALLLVEKRGSVSDQDLQAVRAAGHDDTQIAEIVAVVALNLYTNYFNHVAQTDIDFPVVETAGVTSA